MPSSRDPRSPATAPSASDAEAAIRIVSDRLTSGRRSIAAGPVPESLASRASVEIPHDSLISPAAVTNVAEFLTPKLAPSDLAGLDLQVALPTDGTESFGSAPAPEDPGRFVGSDGPGGRQPGDLPVGQPDNSRRGDQLRGDTIPVLAASGGFGAADLHQSHRPMAAGVAPEVAGPNVESPIVRGEKLAPVPDYTVPESGGMTGDATGDPDRFRLTMGGDDPGFTSMPGTASAGTGAGFDLTKTNELLGQILEVLRKQSPSAGTPLPAAGTSLYADRA